MTTPIETTSDDRLLAALSHLLGLWVALIVWILQKDKSPYVRFQAVQSIAYTFFVWLAGIILSLLFGCLMFGGIFAGIVASSLTAGGDAGFLAAGPIFLSSMGWLLIFPFMLVVWVPRLIAAVQTLQGKPFRYPWLGNLVDNFLSTH